MKPGYSRLLTPLKLGSKVAPSRIVFASHRTNFARHNRFEARHLRYYEVRAKGGAGIVVLEATVVHPSDWPYEYAIFGHQDSIIADYRSMAATIQQHGTLLLAHLTHTGGQGSSHYSQRELWAPSPVQEINSREIAKAMELEDIQAVISGFARCTRAAMEAGLDGVEINAGQYSLIRQFLSPMTNLRQDSYGGELENRLRFIRQVLTGVHQELQGTGILGLRLCGDEYAPWAGIKPEAAIQIAQTLADDGMLDYISVTSGGIYSAHATRAGLYRPIGYGAGLALSIKESISLPVFAQGSIIEPELANELLEQGSIDAVEMTRALIADPDLLHKLRSGKRRQIRPCILCNQGCIVESVQNPALSCAVNPAAGYEQAQEFQPLTQMRNRKQVTIVGGGPAGLQAACVAADLGHHVRLYERQARLGGAIRLAAVAPGRERLAHIVDWLEQQAQDRNIEINMGVEIDPTMVQNQQPDTVIIATGGRPGSDPWLQKVDIPCFNPRQVLEGTVPNSTGTAILLDSVGNQVGMAVAEWLLHKGWRVEIISADLFIGKGLTSTLELTPWYERAFSKGIIFHSQVEVDRFEGQTLIGFNRANGQEIHFPEIDILVDVAQEKPEEALYLKLRELDLAVERAGDCIAPRNLGWAMLEGHRAGMVVK